MKGDAVLLGSFPAGRVLLFSQTRASPPDSIIV
jgi:hypothetical protein